MIIQLYTIMYYVLYNYNMIIYYITVCNNIFTVCNITYILYNNSRAYDVMAWCYGLYIIWNCMECMEYIR